MTDCFFLLSWVFLATIWIELCANPNSAPHHWSSETHWQCQACAKMASHKGGYFEESKKIYIPVCLTLLCLLHNSISVALLFWCLQYKSTMYRIIQNKETTEWEGVSKPMTGTVNICTDSNISLLAVVSACSFTAFVHGQVCKVKTTPTITNVIWKHLAIGCCTTRKDMLCLVMLLGISHGIEIKEALWLMGRAL